MSARDNFRAVQSALGVNATGIPNDETKEAFTAFWDAALTEYRNASPAAPRPAEPAPGATSFTIGADHWLVGAKRNVIEGGSPMTPICLVEHFTAGAGAPSSIESMRDNGLSAHLVIDRDGTIFQCRPFTRTCGHAGVSRWVDPKTGKRWSGLNQCSIGIEIANAGDSYDEISWVRRSGYKGVMAKHRNGGKSTTWEEYPAAQLASVIGVSLALVRHYGLHDVTGHDCIAPERKSDPGPAFDATMKEIREACGFSGLPAVHRA